MFNHMKKSPYTFKLFIAVFIFNLSLLIMLTLSNIHSTKKYVDNDFRSEINSKIKQTNEYLDMYHENIRNIMLSLSLRKDLLATYDKDKIYEFLRTFQKTHSTFIESLYFVSPENQVFSSKQVLYDIIGNKYLDGIVKSNFSSSSMLFTDPYESALSDKTIALYYALKDDNNKYLGHLIFEIQLTKITSYLSATYSTTNVQAYILTSRTGKVISHSRDHILLKYKPKTYPQILDPIFLDRLSQGNDKNTSYYPFSYDNKHYQVTNSQKNLFLWQLYVLSDQDAVDKNIRKIYESNLVKTSLLLIPLLVVAYLLSYLIAKPIRVITAKMNQVTNYNKIQPLDLNYKNEFGQMVDSYNGMMSRIQVLIHEVKTAEQEKKNYELKMLQSQIGPHFLYNTLVCIGSLAKQQKLQEVKILIRSLVTLLSYSFDKTNDLVPLKSEFNNIRSYVDIQRIRYGKDLLLDMELPSNYEDYMVPKLLLQPLVENSIFHGLIPQSKSGKIIIRCHAKGHRLQITVYDNGVGMTNVPTKDKHTGHKERLNSIGIENTDQRIKLQFGDDYGLAVHSKVQVGTVVVLSFPIPSPTITN